MVIANLGGKSETVVLINNSSNPMVLKNAEGKVVTVKRGDTVELLKSDEARALRYPGFVNVANYTKPTSELVGLRARLASAEKELEEMKAAASAVKKGK